MTDHEWEIIANVERHLSELVHELSSESIPEYLKIPYTVDILSDLIMDLSDLL